MGDGWATSAQAAGHTLTPPIMASIRDVALTRALIEGSLWANRRFMHYRKKKVLPCSPFLMPKYMISTWDLNGSQAIRDRHVAMGSVEAEEEGKTGGCCCEGQI